MSSPTRVGNAQKVNVAPFVMQMTAIHGKPAVAQGVNDFKEAGNAYTRFLSIAQKDKLGAAITAAAARFKQRKPQVVKHASPALKVIAGLAIAAVALVGTYYLVPGAKELGNSAATSIADFATRHATTAKDFASRIITTISSKFTSSYQPV